jgi:hypothetical protein
MNDLVNVAYLNDIDEVLAELPYSSATDPYFSEVSTLQRLIVGQSRKLKSDIVRTVKLRFTGKTNAEIAETTNVLPVTVKNRLETEEAKRLLGLMYHLELTQNGTPEGHRRHMLQRIATRAETEDPRVAITALSEINKMEHNGNVLAAGMDGKQPINITINQAMLPKGALDG